MNRDAVLEAYLALPRRDGVSEADVVDLARGLCDRFALFSVFDRPGSKHSGGRAHIGELRALAKAARATVDAIDAMSATSLAFFHRGDPAPRLIRDDLAQVLRHLAAHGPAIEAYPPGRRGRQEDRMAVIVSDIALSAYRWITGRVPAASPGADGSGGPAVRFLAAVLTGLGIRAVPDHLIRKWRAEMVRSAQK